MAEERRTATKNIVQASNLVSARQLLVFVCCCVMSGCASVSQIPSVDSPGLYRQPGLTRKVPDSEELRIIESARFLVGQELNARVSINGKAFILDCIGTVSAVFWDSNIDLQKDFPEFSGNGVSRLHQSLARQGVLHADRYPRPGDVVFWDNTWDANGDGDRSNDLHTHAGVVLSVDDDGSIQYVHASISKGVVIEVMNLLHPASAFDAAGKRLNNTMAIATASGGPRPVRYFAGDVFDRFGDVLGAKHHYLAVLSSPAGGGERN